MNLIEGLLKEIARNRELMQHYYDIGPAGHFGAAFIERDIAEAERAMADGDTVAMLRAYTSLKEWE